MKLLHLQLGPASWEAPPLSPPASARYAAKIPVTLSSPVDTSSAPVAPKRSTSAQFAEKLYSTGFSSFSRRG